MLLIINSGIILSLLIIALFNITQTKKQILTSLCVLIILIIFKILCNKMIKNNKKNVFVKPIATEKAQESCVYTYDKKNNSFDLNYLDNIIVDLKDIVKEDQQQKRIQVDKTGKSYVFCKDSANEEFHYEDLHNKEMRERLNVSDKKSLLLDNVDCANDASCIIQPSIYNFHKH